MRNYLLLGSLLAFLAVALGAFGSHILQSELTEDRYSTYQIAVQYHLFGSLSVLIAALVMDKLSGHSIKWAGRMLVAGTVIFPGSIYILSLTGIGIFGALAPIGGTSFLIGFLLISVAAWKHR
ncbi:DUF423 domain-containing protein [Chengkuizengella axinellae]|uniref:DUF423 domain-containing protein n=1 Tax=Chengkuizengella axinellae TaxID=3064388 RepID=A0ABT9J626_9BACL|nr:DUF423 domain-containing protein [Chengkuizengella sp. 2205SS18-9]MDP5277076.1 DUF423 domain-containing protein [Chengkuizengella sp. 2205SS18-9]